jgi:hypothetical protein
MQNCTNCASLYHTWLMCNNSRIILQINNLNAELKPMCHLQILLGDLTFMVPYIVRISNKMQRYTIYLYLETALNVSGGTSTHHQERIQLYLKHLVFVTPLLLSAVIVEELEPVWVCCGWHTPPTAHSNRFQSHREHGSLSVSVVCRQVEVSATS